ncbi:unnamed protein product [Bemisia tabaci]|uniref:PRELI/MSF1 domain-containing protein n=1 Tax=Bemisia tabaci TaxID=7038 RepID=A0A9P0AE49_BEMTA|nr:unnamed protein product [Bemisia tabaci]
MKYFEDTTTFKYSWDQVVTGFWRRYPNPESSHVLTEDTLSRELKENKLYTKRMLTKTNRLPKWGERFVGNRVVKIIEESILDLQNKTLVTYTRNIGYSSVMSVVERVEYRVDTDNHNQTIAVRSAWIDSSVFGFGRAIQSFGLERFKKNCGKMVSGFNFVLNQLYPTHGTQLPRETVSHSKDRLSDAANKAKSIAKSGPYYASCAPEN